MADKAAAQLRFEAYLAAVRCPVLSLSQERHCRTLELAKKSKADL